MQRFWRRRGRRAAKRRRRPENVTKERGRGGAAVLGRGSSAGDAVAPSRIVRGAGYNVVTECVDPTTNATETDGRQICKPGPAMPFSTSKPNCLIIGDSVSIGYTPFVASALADACQVQHSPYSSDGGAEETAYGDQCLDYFLAASDGTPIAPDVVYLYRVDIPWTSRGAAAAATRIFRGDELRRGYSVETSCDVDIPWRRASHRRYFNWGLHNLLGPGDPVVPGQSGTTDEYFRRADLPKTKRRRLRFRDASGTSRTSPTSREE